MRRLTALAALALTAVLATTGAAAAEPRVGPPLDLQLIVFVAGGPNGEDHATLYVNGRGCLPQDAPASVMVTVDRFPGQVFTAEPRANGRWGVQIDVDTPLDGVWVVNATCDNYFGTTEYPQAQINADQALYAVAGESGGGSGGGGGTESPTPVPIDDGGVVVVANTGSHTGAELGIGVAALLLGALLVLLGRPRATVTSVARSRAAGRHRS